MQFKLQKSLLPNLVQNKILRFEATKQFLT